MIEVRYQRGLYLPEADLWLDPPGGKPYAFVSHAHADHFARHQNVLCSDVTAKLLHGRYGIAENRLETVSFHVPTIRNGFRLRLLPAGHIPGSAMLHVTRISDNATLLYTGDFKTRRSRTAEAVNFLSADTLILETTFGLPGYEFPNPLEVESSVLRFVNDAFTDGETPVLLGYALGKSQEALALLEEHGIPALLHPAAVEMTKVCREAGVPGLPEPLVFDGHAPPGHVIIAPPHAIRTALFKGLKAKRTAMLSGWALQPGAKYRYRVDAMIPFSDHADHPGLLECVQRVRPRRILTTHGYAHEFAAELRSRGMDAWTVTGGDQLELPIQKPARPKPSPRGTWHKRPVCQLADFSDLCRLIEETGSMLEKRGFVSTYLAGLASDDDLRIAVHWLSNTITPRGNTTTAILKKSLLALSGAREDRYRELHSVHRDFIRCARLLLQDLQLQPEALDLSAAHAFLTRHSECSGTLDGIQQLTARLATLHPAEGESILKLLAGFAWTGIDSAFLEEAIAEAFKQAVQDVRAAHALNKDLAETAALARSGQLEAAVAAEPRHGVRSGKGPGPDHPDLPFGQG